jgi:hypothetical protein
LLVRDEPLRHDRMQAALGGFMATQCSRSSPSISAVVAGAEIRMDAAVDQVQDEDRLPLLLLGGTMLASLAAQARLVLTWRIAEAQQRVGLRADAADGGPQGRK